MRIIVTGSREYNDSTLVYQKLNHKVAMFLATKWKYSVILNFTVVHGDCNSGPDRMASEWVKVATPAYASMGLQIIEEKHPADWSLGRKAGPLRNKHMAELGADECLVFWDGKSAGTKNMVDNASTVGIPVRIFSDFPAKLLEKKD